jgi:hypothetical protein
MPQETCYVNGDVLNRELYLCYTTMVWMVFIVCGLRRVWKHIIFSCLDVNTFLMDDWNLGQTSSWMNCAFDWHVRSSWIEFRGRISRNCFTLSRQKWCTSVCSIDIIRSVLCSPLYVCILTNSRYLRKYWIEEAKTGLLMVALLLWDFMLVCCLVLGLATPFLMI